MFNIIALVAGYNKKSSSFKIVNLLKEGLSKSDKLEINFEILYTSHLNLKQCIGCNSCFNFNKCPLDEEDHFNKIKQKIKKCDLLIIASPVYLHNIPSDLKLFIDRISYWTHIFELAGKKSAVISVSSSNGNKEVENYLLKVMNYLGTENILKFGIKVDLDKVFIDELYLDIQIKKYVNIIEKGLLKVFDSNKEQEMIFSAFKKIYSQAFTKGINLNEAYIWNERNFLKYNSLKTYVDCEKKVIIDEEY